MEILYKIMFQLKHIGKDATEKEIKYFEDILKDLKDIKNNNYRVVKDYSLVEIICNTTWNTYIMEFSHSRRWSYNWTIGINKQYKTKDYVRFILKNEHDKFPYFIQREFFKNFKKFREMYGKKWEDVNLPKNYRYIEDYYEH